VLQRVAACCSVLLCVAVSEIFQHLEKIEESYDSIKLFFFCAGEGGSDRLARRLKCACVFVCVEEGVSWRVGGCKRKHVRVCVGFFFFFKHV